MIEKGPQQCGPFLLQFYWPQKGAKDAKQQLEEGMLFGLMPILYLLRLLRFFAAN